VRRDRQARGIAQRVALITTVPLAAYAMWVVSRLPQFRLWAAIGVIVWYLAVRRITRSVALHWIA
jgi:hypothetical protein